MKKRLVLVALTIAAAGAVACMGYERGASSLGPSTTGVSALMGTWTSSNANPVPSPTTCTDFRWTVTQQSGNSASGAFTATCAGGRVSGTATGALNGAAMTWNAQGTAAVPDVGNCPITLSGTAELGSDSIRVPYSGETCVGRVSGVEILRRN
jgi:hypothetical protein